MAAKKKLEKKNLIRTEFGRGPPMTKSAPKLRILCRGDRVGPLAMGRGSLTGCLVSVAALLLGSVFNPHAQTRADEFHGNATPPTHAPTQTDPAVCRDPQIAQVEKETGTVARVFDLRASGTRSGDLGAELEGEGLIQHTKLCAGKANSVVMFISPDKIAGVDQVTNKYFGMTEAEIYAAENAQADKNKLPQPDVALLRRADDAALVDTCASVFEQRGNFNGFPACLSQRAIGHCESSPDQPGCRAIIAKVRKCAQATRSAGFSDGPDCQGYGTPSGSRPVRHYPGDPDPSSRTTVLHGGVSTQDHPTPVGNPATITSSPRNQAPDAAQLKATLRDLDDLIGRAVNYQPPLTNKFLTTLAKDLRQDLNFLSQKPYVPAARIANDMHTGLWGYLTGNAYENNVKLVGGVASNISQTAQLVAEQPDVAAAELTHFLLQASVTGGPSAAEGSTGAQLAAKVEQSAGVLQKVEGEVAGRLERARGTLQAPKSGQKGFYHDIELQLPKEPLKPGGLEELYPVQPRDGGCGQFCATSVLNKAGVKVDILDVVAELPNYSTTGKDLAKVFGKYDVAAYATKGQTIGDVTEWFAKPSAPPLIIGVTEAAGTSGHWLEMTGIANNSQGLLSFNVADPAGFHYLKPISTMEPHFLADGGEVVYVVGRAGR